MLRPNFNRTFEYSMVKGSKLQLFSSVLQFQFQCKKPIMHDTEEKNFNIGVTKRFFFIEKKTLCITQEKMVISKK